MTERRITGPVNDPGRNAVLPAPNFTSSEQTVTADTVLDVAHGLSAIPTLVQVILRCKTAELGYSIDDEVLFPNTGAQASSTTDGGITTAVDATNVTITQGVDIPVHVQSTLNGGAVTVGNFRWVVRAWI